MESPPDYSLNIPSPDNETWLFGQDIISKYSGFSGFHKAANNSLFGIFPDPEEYEGFSFNPQDLFDFSENYVDPDRMIWDNKGPLVFGAFGVVFAFTLLLIGMIWGCYKCCCSKGVKSRKSKEPEGGWEYVENRFGGRDSSRQDLTGGKRKTGPNKLVIIAIGVTLAACGAVYLSCNIGLFVTNGQFSDATSKLFDEVEYAHEDALTYIKLAQKQIDAVFVTSFNQLVNEIPDIDCSKDCLPTDLPCTNICNFGKRMKAEAERFNEALDQVPINETRLDIENVEEEFDKARSGVFHSINGINLLLLLILLLVSLGFGFYACSATRKLGSVFVTCGLGLMFTFGWIIWIFCLALFYLGGGMMVIVPGAFDSIANNGSLVNGGNNGLRAVEYKVPDVPHILQACKNSSSAYEVFNLAQVYEIENISYEICLALCDLDVPDPTDNKVKICDPIEECSPGMKLDCKSSFHPYYLDLCLALKGYSDFAEDAIGTQVGTCEPLYNVINSTVNIFSYQLGSPVGAYWFGLNLLLFFVYPTIFLAIVLQEMLNRC